METHLRRRGLTAVSATAAAALLLAGCTGAGEASPTNTVDVTSPEAFTMMLTAENQNIKKTMEALASGPCEAENDALPLEITTVPQANTTQQIQLLLGQDALPVAFMADTPDIVKKLNDAGELLDMEKALTDLGVIDSVQPAAISTIENIFGSFNVLPTGYNIEGIFYNKQMFADAGITEPETWDELQDAADGFLADGITPFSASGVAGWPLTRWISVYLYRTFGPDAMTGIDSGDAELTDPDYVEATEFLASLGEAGYFGPNVASLDYDGSFSEFLNGNAAMLPMGTWFLAAATNPERNTIGIDNVGFMPYPEFDGGEGSIDQYPANVGVPLTFNASLYDENVAAWLGCLTENFGQYSLSEAGVISGFVPQESVELSELQTDVQTRIDNASDTVLWFEAEFGPKATQDSVQNAALLTTGQTSPADFLSLVQSSLNSAG
jgi:raffinose/stachyose/melibiose transport system substrate-binding protein